MDGHCFLSSFQVKASLAAMGLRCSLGKRENKICSLPSLILIAEETRLTQGRP